MDAAEYLERLRFVRRIAHLSPYAEDVLLDGVREDGDIIPFAFACALANWTVSNFLRFGASDPLRVVLDALEREYVEATAPVRDLIDTGFLESLPFPDEAGHGITQLLGPALRSSLAQETG